VGGLISRQTYVAPVTAEITLRFLTCTSMLSLSPFQQTVLEQDEMFFQTFPDARSDKQPLSFLPLHPLLHRPSTHVSSHNPPTPIALLPSPAASSATPLATLVHLPLHILVLSTLHLPMTLPGLHSTQLLSVHLSMSRAVPRLAQQLLQT